MLFGRGSLSGSSIHWLQKPGLSAQGGGIKLMAAPMGSILFVVQLHHHISCWNQKQQGWCRVLRFRYWTLWPSQKLAHILKLCIFLNAAFHQDLVAMLHSASALGIPPDKLVAIHREPRNTREEVTFMHNHIYIPPGQLRMVALQLCHDSPLAGHLCCSQTQQLTSSLSLWPRMYPII